MNNILKNTSANYEKLQNAFATISNASIVIFVLAGLATSLVNNDCVAVNFALFAGLVTALITFGISAYFAEKASKLESIEFSARYKATR